MFQCDFEKGSLCDLVNDPSMDEQWKTVQAKQYTQLSSSVTTRDHTTNLGKRITLII